MTIMDAVHFLDKSIQNKKVELPDEVFYFISRTTPLVNVDLLIQDEKGCTLLAWRDDIYCGKGWHVPGGIVRFQEPLEERIRKTAIKELGVPVAYDPTPIHFVEMIHPEQEDRSHFISFLYKCSLPAGFTPDNKNLTESDIGYLKWHDTCPDNLINVHKVYRQLINGNWK